MIIYNRLSFLCFSSLLSIHKWSEMVSEAKFSAANQTVGVSEREAVDYPGKKVIATIELQQMSYTVYTT